MKTNVLSVAGFNWAGTTTDNNSVNSLMIIGGYLNTSTQTVATATTAAGMQFYNGGFYWYGNSGLTPGNVYTNTQNMFLTVDGNLILGNASSTTFKLDVSGTARLTGALTATSATFVGNVTIRPSAGYNAYFQVNSTTFRTNYLNDALTANISAAYRATDFEWQNSSGQPSMNLTSAGNVGIGTSDPQSSLHIYSTNATAIIQNSSTSAVGNTSRLLYHSRKSLKVFMLLFFQALTQILYSSSVIFLFFSLLKNVLCDGNSSLLILS
jgi:hypothetical protein